MRVVMLVSNEEKQRYVAREVGEVAELAGVIIEDRYRPSYRFRNLLQASGFNPFTLSRDLWRKFLLQFYQRKDKEIIKRYFYENGRPIPWGEGVVIKKVQNINSRESLRWVRELKPELIIVFGTRIIKPPLMEIPPQGIINVHTGLSPYYRGGQCTFWALYNNEPEYIGVTIHFLDEGVDSGEIIYSARPRLEPEDNICSIECKLTKLGTRLLLQAIKDIERGKVRRIPQWMEGKLFLNSMFTLEKRLILEKKLRRGLIPRYLKNLNSSSPEVKFFWEEGISQ